MKSSTTHLLARIAFTVALFGILAGCHRQPQDVDVNQAMSEKQKGIVAAHHKQHDEE